MQAYCTIPAAASAEAEEPLSREVKVNAKTILGGVAVTAFVLGMMAATAARSSSPVGARLLRRWILLQTMRGHPCATRGLLWEREPKTSRVLVPLQTR